MLKIPIDQDPYNQGVEMFPLKFIPLHPGLSFIIGCNGSGKTTLVNQIDKFADESPDIARYTFSIEGECPQDKSDGQHHADSLIEFMNHLSDEIKRLDKGTTVIVTGDLSKLGITAETVSKFKHDMSWHVIPEAESSGIDLYMILIATDFEYLVDKQSIDVQTFTVLHFNNYISYKQYIMNSKLALDKRYAKIMDKSSSNPKGE